MYKIKDIYDTSDVYRKSQVVEGYEEKFDGIIIETYEGETFRFIIENETQCCENRGYFEINEFDKPLEFYKDAKILKIELSDSIDGKTYKVLEDRDFSKEYVDKELRAEFINIYTTKGLLQITIYNEHNGYYGHYVFFDILENNKKITERSYL